MICFFFISSGNSIMHSKSIYIHAQILAMNPRPKMRWIKRAKGTRGWYDPIHLTSFSSYKGFDNYYICAFSFVTLASKGATVQLYVILSFKHKFNLFKYQISANQQEAESSANVNKHWKPRAQGNDVITIVIFANQPFASAFSMQILK